MIVPQFRTASAVLWVYRAQFTLPFRPLSSPSLHIATVAKRPFAHQMGEPVRRSATSTTLPNAGSAPNRFLAFVASVSTLSLRRPAAWHFDGQSPWT